MRREKKRKRVIEGAVAREGLQGGGKGVLLHLSCLENVGKGKWAQGQKNEGVNGVME